MTDFSYSLYAYTLTTAALVGIMNRSWLGAVRRIFRLLQWVSSRRVVLSPMQTYQLGCNHPIDNELRNQYFPLCTDVDCRNAVKCPYSPSHSVYDVLCTDFSHPSNHADTHTHTRHVCVYWPLSQHWLSAYLIRRRRLKSCNSPMKFRLDSVIG